MEARVWQPNLAEKDWDPSRITYFSLIFQNDANGEPELAIITAVDREGIPLERGAICAITKQQKLRLYSNIRTDIGCAVDEQGRIKVFS